MMKGSSYSEGEIVHESFGMLSIPRMTKLCCCSRGWRRISMDDRDGCTVFADKGLLVEKKGGKKVMIINRWQCNTSLCVFFVFILF